MYIKRVQRPVGVAHIFYSGYLKGKLNDDEIIQGWTIDMERDSQRGCGGLKQPFTEKKGE